MFITIKIGRKKVKQENYVRFLGVLLDSPLCWKTHIAELSKKSSRAISLFYKIRHYAPLETLMLLYHGLFGSLLSYGIIVWGLTYPSLTEKIYILQTKVVRVIAFNSKIAFSTPIFDKLQVIKQEHILQLQLSSFIYECINNISPVRFQNYCNKILNIHKISTRQAVRGDLFYEH